MAAPTAFLTTFVLFASIFQSLWSIEQYKLNWESIKLLKDIDFRNVANRKVATGYL